MNIIEHRITLKSYVNPVYFSQEYYGQKYELKSFLWLDRNISFTIV